MGQQVTVFTDTYLPTVNGVTYTIKSWLERWNLSGGSMDVVYPRANGYEPTDAEHPVRSLPFPFYEGYRLGAPSVPDDLDGPDVVHAHTPFALGLAALRLLRGTDVPLVASYHTPASEYATYLAPTRRIAAGVERLTRAYERWFYGHADVVLVPTVSAQRHVTDVVGISTPTHVVSNGVDVDRFRPTDAADFRERYDLEGSLVGYTGRHGHEKCLHELLAAVDGLSDVTVVLGGDGPARPSLERRADRIDADVRFLGFLAREELPAFYSALDVFAFPSPVETQGLVALEANACGTPVVGVDCGALSDTIVHDVTGYHYPAGEVDAFRAAIERALHERNRLEAACLERREEVSVENSLATLREVYESL